MIIGVDIDGVLCDLNGFVRKYFKKYLEDNNIEYKLDKSKDQFYKQYNVSKSIEKDFWDQYVFKYAKIGTMINNASKIMNKLHNDGHKIIIITSRLFSKNDDEKGNLMKENVVKWFKKNKIYYDEMYFSNETIGKKKLVLQNNVDIMIDDSPRNLLELCEYVPCICFHNAGNHNATGKNIIRANSWKFIYNFLKTFDKSKYVYNI